jgi:hypothetical protein
MKIHEYNQMYRWLTRPKDKFSKEEKKQIVKKFYAERELERDLGLGEILAMNKRIK